MDSMSLFSYHQNVKLLPKTYSWRTFTMCYPICRKCSHPFRISRELRLRKSVNVSSNLGVSESIAGTTQKGIDFVGLETLSIQHIRLYQQPHSIKWSYFIWKVHQAQRPTLNLYIGIYICHHMLFRRDLVSWGLKNSGYSISSHMNNRKALNEVTLCGRCIKHSDRLRNCISGSTFVTACFLEGI